MITSGETDIPWELVHVWAADAGADPEGRGFLGRPAWSAGSTTPAHPTHAAVRRRAAPTTSSPTYGDTSLLVLDRRRVETEYLRPFGATAIDPPDAAGMARLHHERRARPAALRRPRAFSNDRRAAARAGRWCSPELPHVGATSAAPTRTGRRMAFSLEDLRRALPGPSAEPRFGDPGPLVVLNACRIGQAPSTRSEVGGFAETFLRGGAGAFVGCLWSVGDQPAREFVAAFYAALDDGSHASPRPRSPAGRRRARGGDLSWLAYTVYAHPDARLADRPQPAAEPDPNPRGTHHDHHQKQPARPT